MFNDLSLTHILSEGQPTEEYWGSQGAGCIFIAKDTGRILLAFRSEDVSEGSTWGTWGGKIDVGESPVDAVKREIEEETGYTDKFQISHIHTYKDGEFQYFNFLVLVPFEFTPKLNWEHSRSEWVEFGDWNTPMHYGLEELLHVAGEKIHKVIETLKKKGLKEGAMDAPNAIHQPASHGIDKEFINYIKKVENGIKIGFRNGMWHPHKDPGGGKMAIAYGHNIQKGEEWMLKGITDKQAEEILIKDLLVARKQVYRDIEHMFKVKIALDSRQEQMLMDFAYNLGNIRTYPKFVRAVLNKDWNEAKKHYKRTYKDSSGKHRPMSRNKEFADKFLSPANKPIAIKELQATIQQKSLGLEDEDTYGYELRSPYSWIRYSHSPSLRLFSIQKVGTDPEHQNQGHAKELLNHFFEMVKKARGTVEVDSYTTSGHNYLKHVVDRMGEMFGVRVI
jgi:8-oxo-dGTP pyrophosphatase MutT (NUDIX family)/GH24 family phage-related lysozyme (muramidase)